MQSARRELKSLAARILKDAGPEDSVVLAWPLACGSTVAERTEALSFADGILHVLVPDSGWKAQLESFLVHYRQKLSELSGQKIQSIVYEIGRPNAFPQRSISR